MLIDLHAHTSGISKCCQIAAPNMLRVARENGMDGVVLCNHYQKSYVTDGDFDAFARRYVAEYEYTRAEGEAIGVRVLFGIEVTTDWIPEGKDCSVHLLIYGVDTDFVLQHPRMFEYTQEELYRTVHEAGGILVQAHPWRRKDRLIDTRYLDGIEISCHPLYEGTYLAPLAEIAAREGLILTCGGDFHNDTHRPTCGVYLPNGVENTRMLAAYLAGADTVTLAVQEVDERCPHTVIFQRGVGIVTDGCKGEQ
ncbi:MAG: hypothetical protein E7644_04920 [Ruminococcaceae bacterium]|nr:hypothetical protein [Oscillospiraceae bacterium]